jgi:hypothetical protein
VSGPAPGFILQSATEKSYLAASRVRFTFHKPLGVSKVCSVAISKDSEVIALRKLSSHSASLAASRLRSTHPQDESHDHGHEHHFAD